MLTARFKHLDLKAGDRVLDLGCGEGRHVHGLYLEGGLHIVGVDLSHKDVLTARHEIEDNAEIFKDAPGHYSFGVGDALRLPFADSSFDKIICSEVLEHIPDYEKALEEITRLLKPGGTLAISVPRYWPEWVCWKLSENYHNTPGGHVRIFEPGTLINDVVSRRFRLFRRHSAHGLHSPYWWLKCAMWQKRDTNWLIRQYHNFLVWDIVKQPWLTRFLAKIADPLMGKSVVFYFVKENRQ